MDSENVVRHDDGVVYRKLDEGEGGVILHLETAVYHGVNETGAFVWELLVDEPTIGSVIAELQARFDQPADIVAADVESFLAALEERLLIAVRNGHPNPRSPRPLSNS